ncbi:MAG: peptidylprolyl isomerase [Aquificota bacterium]|nr:peptidylprolyl isomerase [Aquificota bacterium]
MSVEKNTVVSFHYTLFDKESGEVIESSLQWEEPVTFLVGAGEIIPGLESRMMGMKVGEKRRIEVPAEEAYGQRDPDLVQKIPREYLSRVPLKEGMTLQAHTPDGRIVTMVVVGFNDEEVEVDLNHPLAGKDLLFEVEVVSIREATPEEILHRHSHGTGDHPA